MSKPDFGDGESFEESIIIDVDGTKYRCGRDQYGYFTIEAGEVWEDPETGEDKFKAYVNDDRKAVNLDPSSAQEVAHLIEEMM